MALGGGQVPHYVPISAKDEWNFDELLEKVWEYAKMIRMYVHCAACATNHGRTIGLLRHALVAACGMSWEQAYRCSCWWLGLTGSRLLLTSFLTPWLSTRRCGVACSYTKPRGQIPDYSAPVVLHATHPSIADFCDRIHKGLLRDLK